MKNKIFYLFIFTFLFISFFSNISYASSAPKLVTKLDSAFEDIGNWLVNLSTPAAAVAVGTGVFMKKFSFGDEEKIRTAKKLIRGSLFSYGFILAIDLILSAIKALIA
jgi:hypothetical protein